MGENVLSEAHLEAARDALRFPRPCRCFTDEVPVGLPECRVGPCADAVRSVAHAIALAEAQGMTAGMRQASEMVDRVFVPSGGAQHDMAEKLLSLKRREIGAAPPPPSGGGVTEEA